MKNTGDSKVQQRRERVLDQIRQAIWSMRSSRDIEQVTVMVGKSLNDLGVSFNYCSVNVIGDERGVFDRLMLRNLGWKGEPLSEPVAKILHHFMNEGQTVYRRDLDVEDPYDERERVNRAFGAPIRSVVDVPFSHGTLGVMSLLPDAFSGEDIAALEHMAEVLTEGFTRLGDLRELEHQKRLIEAFDHINRQMLSTLDPERIVDILATEIINLRLFRSLVFELVDVEKGISEIVRDYYASGVTYLKDLETTEQIQFGQTNEGARGLRLSIEEDALRREIVAEGEMLVIEGWDERFNRKYASPEKQAGKVAFFVPVQREGEVLAIFSTGCQREDKEQMLAHINALQPLLGQVALVLYWARLHAAAQEQDRLKLAAQAVRLKIASMRQSEDLGSVADEISAQLRAVGVEHSDCSIQVIGPEGRGFIPIQINISGLRQTRRATFEGNEHLDNGLNYPWVEEVWRTGKTHYQPCTPTDGPLLAGFSVVDAAFSRGTLAISSRGANAFSARDIELVEHFAAVLSEGFQRFEDLEARAHADTALYEQNELLNAIIEGTQDAIDVKDRAGRRILVNSTVLRWLGLTVEEVLGKRNEDFFSPELARKLDAEDERVMGSGKIEVNENMGRGSWGLRYVQAQKFPLYDKNGQVRGLVGIGRDITEIRRREHLQQALTQVRQEVWRMQRQRDIENVIRVLYQSLVGLIVPMEDFSVHYIDKDRKEPIVHSWRYHSAKGEWQDEIIPNTTTVWQMWERGEVTYRPDIEAHQGQEIFANYSRRYGHPVRSIVDVPYAHGTLAINSSRPEAFSPSDIELLQKMTAALNEGFARGEDLLYAEQQERLIGSLNRIGQQVSSTLDQDRVLDILVSELMRVGVLRSLVVGLVDREQEQIEIVRGHRVKGVRFIGDFELDAEYELIQSPIVGQRIDLKSDDLSAIAARSGQRQMVAGWDERFDERFTERQDRRGQISVFIPIHHDADTIAVLCTGCEESDREQLLGNIEAMRPLFDQVAVALYHAQLYAELQRARNELEERVRQRTQDLEVRNQDLEAFSYSVSHDLRAPLRGVTGFAQILVERYSDRLDEKGAHYLDNIVTAGQQMDRLIGELLSYSRLGRKTIDLVAIALGPVLKQVLTTLEVRLAECGGHIECRGEWPQVVGNQTLLEQIFANLLDNALTYVRAGVAPHIELSFALEGEEIVVCVADNGIGIAPEHAEKAFAIFQRLGPANRHTGTGIGLATVRKSAELMGGQVRLESELGSGSRFFVHLCVASPQKEK